MSSKSFRPLAALAVVALVEAPAPAAAQYFSSGTLVKPLATGVQTVAHGLPAGVTPSVIIFWTSGNATTGSNGHPYYWVFGVADGVSGESRCVSANGLDSIGANTANAARRMAAAAITFVKAGSTITVQSEADLCQTGTCAGTPPWDTTNFYLNWTTMVDTVNAYHIQFLAIGGTGVQAKIVDWTAPAGTGTKSITSLSFEPSIVLHFGTMDTAATLPSNTTDAAFMLGAMDIAGHQWANSFYVKNSVSTTATARAQISGDVATLEGTNSGATETVRASYCTVAACGTIGMLSNGFEVNFTTNSVGAMHMFSLAMAGTTIWAGTFTKPTTTCNPCSPEQTTTISGLGFQPAAVMFTSVMNVNAAAPAASTRYGMGAFDGTHRQCAALTDQNGKTLGGSTKTTAWQIAHDNSPSPCAIEETDGDVGTSYARMDNVAFNSDGFVGSWTYNTDTKATEITYLALGALGASSVTLASFTATRLPDGKVRLDWRTGYEVDNVGFRLYREQNGRRVRITSSIVPGSALMGAGRGMSVGGRNYTWSDAAGAPPDAGPVQYWLEDVDLKGKSTWHGPFVPIPSPQREPR